MQKLFTKKQIQLAIYIYNILRPYLSQLAYIVNKLKILYIVNCINADPNKQKAIKITFLTFIRQFIVEPNKIYHYNLENLINYKIKEMNK